MTVVPNPVFQSLSEAAVLEGLADPDPANPIAREVARLIAAYTDNFYRHVERLGYMPPHILHIKARWPIEAVAIRLAKEAIRETTAAEKSK